MSISSFDLKQIWFTIIQSKRLKKFKHIQRMLQIDPSLINAPDSNGKTITSILTKNNDGESRSGAASFALCASIEKVVVEVKKSVKEIILDYVYTLKANPETNISYIEMEKLVSNDELKYLFFMSATKIMQHDLAIEMLKTNPFLVNAQDNKGRSISMMATFIDDTELSKTVMKCEFLDLDIKDNLGLDVFCYLTRLIPCDERCRCGNVYEVIRDTLKYYQSLKGDVSRLFSFCVNGDFQTILFLHKHYVLTGAKP